MVVVLAAGMLGAGVFSLRKFSAKGKAEREAAELVDALWQFRSHATTGMKSPCLDFPTDSTYRLFSAADDPVNGFLEGDGDRLLETRRLRGGAKIRSITGGDEPNHYICFESRGLMGAASGALDLKVGMDTISNFKRLRFLPATGMAKIL